MSWYAGMRVRVGPGSVGVNVEKFKISFSVALFLYILYYSNARESYAGVKTKQLLSLI